MRRKYDFCSFILIPVLTFMLAYGFSWTDTNFSVIGNAGGRHPAFLLWGALVGSYFYLYTDRLREWSGCDDGICRGLTAAALISFVTGIGFPYLPEQLPNMSRLHVLFSFASTQFLSLAHIRLLVLLQHSYGCKLHTRWCFLAAFTLGAAVLFVKYGIITGLLEVYVILGSCLYLRSIHGLISKKV
jgi:hypothetical protein